MPVFWGLNLRATQLGCASPRQEQLAAAAPILASPDVFQSGPQSPNNAFGQPALGKGRAVHFQLAHGILDMLIARVACTPRKRNVLPSTHMEVQTRKGRSGDRQRRLVREPRCDPYRLHRLDI